MSESATLLTDTLSAHEGKAYITINGSNREMFELSKFSAELELTVASKQRLGHRAKQHKVTGVEGTGSMTCYFMNSQQLNYAITYINSGTFAGFTVTVTNDDPASSVGTQNVAIYNVIPKKFPVAYLEESDDPITYDTDITFDKMAVLSSFNLPTTY
jgi:hypothetical protein